MHFKDKLEVKVGLTSRYFASFYAPVYDGYSNDFYVGYYNKGLVFDESGIKLNSNVTFDFFVVGKIDKAVFGITFENIIRTGRLLTTNYYPNQQRGGLFNVWSRFNITWYFLN